MTEPTAPAPKRRSYRATGIVVLLLVGAAAGYYFYEQSQIPKPVDEFQALRPYFLKLAENQKLAADYKDTNGDLVAEAPSDPAKLQKVETIGFSSVGTTDEARAKAEEADWKDLMAAIEKATGKKVKYLADLGSPTGQVEAMKAGRLQVTAFNTGAVTSAVNTGGFIPLFCPANEAGEYAYTMEILVRAGSKVTKPEELKGKTVGFVAMSSNSGAKAPMYILKERFGMLPGRDYKYKLIGDHYALIAQLLYSDECDAVCVASDLKNRAVASGKVPFGSEEKELKAEQFRVIFASDPFPPLCFGVAHDLPNELKAQIEKAFADYRFADSSAGKYAAQGKVRFAPVNYKRDWKFVRDIDLALSKLAEAK